MPTMNMIQALNDAHKVMMRRDEDIVVFGEDVGRKGGVHGATLGLQEKFGVSRVFDTSLSEEGIIGRAVAMAPRSPGSAAAMRAPIPWRKRCTHVQRRKSNGGSPAFASTAGADSE